MVFDTSWILVVFASLTAISFAEPEFDHLSNTSLVEKTVQKKICDGIKDCSDGEDEAPAMCARWKCPDDSIRCENNNVCLPPAHTSLCSGKAVCPDKSDQSYCNKKEYTGCMARTALGIKIMNCGSCFCDLRNKSAILDKSETGGEEKQSLGILFRSSLPQSKVYIVARICMERTQSNLFCDGVADCTDGEDEDGELCYTTEDRLSRVQTNNVDLEENTKVEDDNVRKDTIADTGDFNFHGDYIDMTIIVIIFFISCVTVVGICFIIIFVTYKVIKTKKKQGLQQLLSPSLNHHGSNPSFHDIIPQLSKTSPPLPQKPSWSLRTANIVKELGNGFYSKVYLAQDVKGSFVALKTVDSQKTTNSEECISNEIDILSTIGSHLNIVRLLGFNREEKLIVMEYCFNGNLKDYITRYRDYYLDEINPSTGELREETYIHNSPTDSETFPMSDFLSSMHADVDNEDSLKRRNKDVCSMAGNKSLIKTRRLLYWSYQISRGMKHLGDLGIIHRDVALRNMLLTNNDVVKIADFGLAVNIFSQTGCMTSGSAMPQYWSKNNKPQPYKWMAPESLVANVFSQSSDVWSYGVTLWEMFTLGSEPHGNMSPMELTQVLQTGHRLDHCRRAPLNISRMMTHCWHADPAMRPGFDTIVMGLAGYMSKTDRTSYDARSTRLDTNSLGMVDSGYGVSTPSTGTTSKSSTRSRTVSKCSELSWLPSSSSSQVPSPKIARASYWANYKGMNSSESQVYSSIDNYPTRHQHTGLQQSTRNADRQFNTLDTYLRGRNNHY